MRNCFARIRSYLLTAQKQGYYVFDALRLSSSQFDQERSFSVANLRGNRDTEVAKLHTP